MTIQGNVPSHRGMPDCTSLRTSNAIEPPFRVPEFESHFDLIKVGAWHNIPPLRQGLF
jgi:hypothetical protein